jgi:hypothetical protein
MWPCSPGQRVPAPWPIDENAKSGINFTLLLASDPCCSFLLRCWSRTQRGPGLFGFNLWKLADRWMSSPWVNPWRVPVAPARGFALVGFGVGLVVLAWIATQVLGA